MDYKNFQDLKRSLSSYIEQNRFIMSYYVQMRLCLLKDISEEDAKKGISYYKEYRRQNITLDRLVYRLIYIKYKDRNEIFTNRKGWSSHINDLVDPNDIKGTIQQFIQFMEE